MKTPTYQQSYYQRNKESIKAQQKIYRKKKKLVSKNSEPEEQVAYRSFITALLAGSVVVTPMFLMAVFPQYSWPIFATILCVAMFLTVFTFVLVFSVQRNTN